MHKFITYKATWEKESTAAVTTVWAAIGHVMLPVVLEMPYIQVDLNGLCSNACLIHTNALSIKKYTFM